MSKNKRKKTKQEKEKNEYIWQAYLTVYLPFRVELKLSDVQKANCPHSKTDTKLANKSVKNVIDTQIGRYNLYNHFSKNKEKNIKSFVSRYTKQVDKLIKDPNKDKRREPDVHHFKKSDVLSIGFSIYNDTKSFNYKKIGFLKILVGLEYDKQASDIDKIEGIRYAYDVISRNIKNKKVEEKFNIEFDYKKLSEYFNKLRIAFPTEASKIYIPLINKNEDNNDWAFNYDRKDRRGYSFAYIIQDEDINKYDKEINSI